MSIQVIASVTNDINHDNRVDRICSSLQNNGYELMLVGRKRPGSKPIEKRIYSTRRFSLPFDKGPLFYASYNVRLLFFLLFSKADIFLANDLDTLPANFLAARIRGKKLVYDSHEYFCYVPELNDRPYVRKIWKFIEKKIFPKLKNVMTVNSSLADIFSDEYKVNIEIIRNVPVSEKHSDDDGDQNNEAVFLKEHQDKSKIIYQGVLNKDRGIEESILAMRYVENAVFLIAGEGDLSKELRKLAKKEGLSDKVEFLGRINLTELGKITRLCTLGLSLEKDTCLSYRYSLPNKIFNYMHAGIPVLSSDLIEKRGLIEKCEMGLFIESYDPEHIGSMINEMLSNSEKIFWWKQNSLKGAKQFNWEIEEQKLLRFYENIA
ncbi:MAG TPA: glycosyltransferase [Flavobacteriales bacterium]|nr:glycosyltransferase [Flavobacteriales bacterium]HIA13071.1 glycosyltransferase [Flavobacteriales bacterium]HIO73451.1 glycosyltransferase [Flavobacteriales bacterium]